MIWSKIFLPFVMMGIIMLYTHCHCVFINLFFYVYNNESVENKHCFCL